MRAAAKILDIGRIGRGGAGPLGVGPGLLIRRFAGRFVERDDALARLRYVRAGAEVLQICRIGGDGAGLLGIGPGLLVGLLARLLIRRLLLLLCLLRIRGLAASRRERICARSPWRAHSAVSPVASNGSRSRMGAALMATQRRARSRGI